MIDESELLVDSEGVMVAKPILKLGRSYTRLKDKQFEMRFDDGTDEDRVSKKRKVLRRNELSADTML